MIVLSDLSGSGKSTLVSRLLARFDDVSGYQTERMRGTGMSFRLVPIGGKAAFSAPFLSIGADGVRFDAETYFQTAAASVASDSRLIVLDEIGGIELTHDGVFAWLMRLKQDNRRLLVVFKSERNCRRLLEKAALTDEAERLLWQRRDALLSGVEAVYDMAAEAALWQAVEALVA